MTFERRGARSMLLAPLMLVALLAAAGFSGAQVPQAQHPSPGANVLFAHFDDEAEVWWMSTGVGEEHGYVGGIGTAGQGTTYSWTVPADPPLAGDLVLDPEGTVEMYAYIGRTGQGGAGAVMVEATLTVGETLVAAGEAETITYAQSYEEVHWSVAPEVDRIPADGGDLVWTVSVTQGARNGIFLRLNDPDGLGASRVELPITAVEGLAEPGFIVEEVAGAALDVELAFANATSDGYQFNWTASEGDYTIAYDAGVGNGSATITAEDASGGLIVNRTFTGPDEGSMGPVPLSGLVILRVAFLDFVGNVSVSVIPYEQPSQPQDTAEPTPGATQDGDAGEPAGNATGNQTLDDGGSLPGFGLVAATAALGLGVVLARGRRD